MKVWAIMYCLIVWFIDLNAPNTKTNQTTNLQIRVHRMDQVEQNVVPVVDVDVGGGFAQIYRGQERSFRENRLGASHHTVTVSD